MISINASEDPLYPLQVSRGEQVLTVRFDDVGCDGKFGLDGNDRKVITKETAVEMVRFIHKNQDKNFIVHCMAGISRSSAVCLYISLVYGHSLKPQFWNVSHPNAVVLGSLMVARCYLGATTTQL